ncbi:helix-turn-helix transcriptional regulator [Clostridium sp. CF012]|uniref:helix-turn-helix transcriptional regulator n=1 Tax=Clostridium sp. CF012 TaxID=2843319 RepID=UPI00209BB333|nr:AraC family transcriptional regulator [Clostridium sp. CF012]
MNFIQNLQRAIDYMEEHILEPITYEDVARHVYMSSYHFHRTFSLVTGITANEYIRNRRLSMAGQELSISDAKVIDIALKYGYDSPESRFKDFNNERFSRTKQKIQLGREKDFRDIKIIDDYIKVNSL